MKAIVYDAGVLVAAERTDRRAWAAHRLRLAAGILPIVSSTVVAQVSRSAEQAQLRRFLFGCEVVSFDTRAAHRVGAILGKARQTDVVDASVVDLAATRSADILTSHPRDLRRLVAATNADVVVLEI